MLDLPDTTLEKRRLGRTEYHVTTLGLGCYRFTLEFGVPRADSLALLDRALSLGINYMDTAPSYGTGESEELIGRALSRHPDKQVFISSKVGQLDKSIALAIGNDAYHSEDCIRRVVDHTLWLLQKDYLEMLFIHEPEVMDWWGWDEKTLDAPVLRVFEKLKEEKVIGAIGLGSNTVDFPGRLAETGRIDVIEIANGYNLVGQRIEERILPAAEEHDIGIVAGGPFRAGLLAAKQPDRIGKRFSKIKGQILSFYQLSDETGLPIHELNLRYILSNPAIHSVIPGAQKPEEVEANYQAVLNGPLPDDIMEAIAKIQRGTKT